jgi:hypothetical protein
MELGRKARVCECVDDSVRIDIDQLLADAEEAKAAKEGGPGKPRRKSEVDGVDGKENKTPRKRKSSGEKDGSPSKKVKIEGQVVTKSVKLKLGPRPPTELPLLCCLCANTSEKSLLRVMEPPVGIREAGEGIKVEGTEERRYMAHELCANVVPETWVDEIDVPVADGSVKKERVVFGVNAIVRDRWNLVSANVLL